MKGHALRNVSLEMGGRLHSFFRTLIENPPEGYRFYSKDYYKSLGITRKQVARFERLLYYPTRLGIPPKVVRSYISYFAKPRPYTDLVMTNGLLDFRSEAWVAAVEEAHSSFLGTLYDNRLMHGVVERALRNKNCKALICFNKAASNSMLATYEGSGFANKIVQVPPSVPLVPKRERNRKKQVDILFLGSANFPVGLTTKGFHIALRAFLRLTAQLENVRLIVRESLPDSINRSLANNPKILVVNEALNDEQFGDLMWSSDILVLPSLFTPWTSFLDAMNFELPIVTVGTHANAELVRNGESGFVSNPPKGLESVTGNYFIPNWKALKQVHRVWLNDYQGVVEDVSKGLKALVLDREARLRMGSAGRKNLEPGGRFSIGLMNSKLKEIFDHAITR